MPSSQSQVGFGYAAFAVNHAFDEIEEVIARNACYIQKIIEETLLQRAACHRVDIIQLAVYAALLTGSGNGECGQLIILIELVNGQTEQTFKEESHATRAVGSPDAMEEHAATGTQVLDYELERGAPAGGIDAQGIVAEAVLILIDIWHVRAKSRTVAERYAVYREVIDIHILAQIQLGGETESAQFVQIGLVHGVAAVELATTIDKSVAQTVAIGCTPASEVTDVASRVGLDHAQTPRSGELSTTDDLTGSLNSIGVILLRIEVIDCDELGGGH